MVATAVFALVWLIVRAKIQSVTIDEANTCWWTIFPASPAYWLASANNHVLNSVLIRLSTTVFGFSPFTIRLPALCGACLYISACLYITRLLGRRLLQQWPLFVCLVFNPFVADYLVAARGYGLALAFLTAMIALLGMLYFERRRTSVALVCALASGFAGLSFSANFVFVYVDAFTWLAIVAVAVCHVRWDFELSQRERLISYRRICLAAILPGLLVVLLVSAPSALGMRHEYLNYGAHSLKEMMKSVTSPSFRAWNPYILNPLFKSCANFLAAKLVAILIIAGAICLGSVVYDQLRNRDFRRRPELLFAANLLLIWCLTLLAHWWGLRFFDLLLPKARTAISFVAVAFLFLGVLGSNRSESAASRWSVKALQGALLVCALYFLGSMRLTYFDEWKFNADMRQIYSLLSCYNRNFEIRKVGTMYLYTDTLNFYRFASRQEAFDEFSYLLTPDAQVYVLNDQYPDQHEFLEQQQLQVIYKASMGDTVVAVRPGLKPLTPEGGCVVPTPLQRPDATIRNPFVSLK
jgi:hypothetical protein